MRMKIAERNSLISTSLKNTDMESTVRSSMGSLLLVILIPKRSPPARALRSSESNMCRARSSLEGRGMSKTYMIRVTRRMMESPGFLMRVKEYLEERFKDEAHSPFEVYKGDVGWSSLERKALARAVHTPTSLGCRSSRRTWMARYGLSRVVSNPPAMP